jgi:hypothetical protein
MHQFDRQLRAIAKPELAARGFEFDGRRTFTRTVEMEGGPALQLVEFQRGMRHLAGRFTVNVGVFAPHFLPPKWPVTDGAPYVANCLPAMRKRLGLFYDPPRSWFQAVLPRARPVRGDFWWEQHDDEAAMAQSLRSALAPLTEEALPWLDKLSCEAAFKWALKELDRAKRWKESQGTPGAGPQYILKYFGEVD